MMIAAATAGVCALFFPELDYVYLDDKWSEYL
jgi:hypothetical protein